MLKWLEKTRPAVFFAFCILFAFHAEIAQSASAVSFEITAVKSALSADTLEYTVLGDTLPVYNVSERFSPFRVVVDIAGAAFAEGVSTATTQIPENSFSTLTIEDLGKQEPKIKRFIFKLSDSHDYSVVELNNGFQIILSPKMAKPVTGNVQQSPSTTILKDFQIVSTPNTTTISILSNRTIENYTVNSVQGTGTTPPRMYIDIENVGINELGREKQIGTSVSRVRVTPRNNGTRIVFDSAAGKDLFKYTVAPSPSGLDIVIDETGYAAAQPVQKKQIASRVKTGGDATLDELITSSEQLLSQDPEQIISRATADEIASLEDDFSFSGYKKQRISVDFYKIDIHNVFRLFREITDLNIIVDEGVKGSLTLALDDVPWDFALDIILNLANLKKEEKFNTIVIYPAKKEFVWPTRAEDNLDFVADIEVIEEQQEALIISKMGSHSKEIMKAKELIVKAQDFEKRDDIEDAAVFYNNALELWPTNTKISNRLASLYLVNLGMNAKAVYYAEKTLANDPANKDAALYAAIGSANMQRLAEANEFFIQSISDTPPRKDALMSYAAFSENNGQNEAALKLIDKYRSYYGENVDSMVAKARLLDKLGRSKEATDQYYALLVSGFQLRPDLKTFIEGRVATKTIN